MFIGMKNDDQTSGSVRFKVNLIDALSGTLP